jgi:hypothetical protein
MRLMPFTGMPAAVIAAVLLALGHLALASSVLTVHGIASSAKLYVAADSM